MTFWVFVEPGRFEVMFVCSLVEIKVFSFALLEADLSAEPWSSRVIVSFLHNRIRSPAVWRVQASSQPCCWTPPGPASRLTGQPGSAKVSGSCCSASRPGGSRKERTWKTNRVKESKITQKHQKLRVWFHRPA